MSYAANVAELTRSNSDFRRVLFTVYGPPDHQPGRVHHTKDEADADEHDVPPGEQ